MAKKLGIEVSSSAEVKPKFMRSVLHEYDAAVVAAGARIDRDRFQYHRRAPNCCSMRSTSRTGECQPAAKWSSSAAARSA